MTTKSKSKTKFIAMPTKNKNSRFFAAGSAIGVILLTTVLAGLINQDNSSKNDTDLPSEIIREVNTSNFKPDNIPLEIEITGRIKSTQRIQLFSEVQGIFTGSDRPFRTGVKFKQGDVLIRTDETQYLLGLNAQRSRFFSTMAASLSNIKLDYPIQYTKWLGYVNQFDPESTLSKLPDTEDSQLKLYLASRGIFDQYYSIRSSESMLTKYVIRAPFNGELRNADLTPGDLIMPGARLGEFVGDAYELESFVSLRDLNNINQGDKVQLIEPISGYDFNGTISRIGSSIDPNTQATPIYIEIQNNTLRSGQYVEGKISGKVLENAVKIPRNLLSRGNTVLIAKNGKATHKRVDPLFFMNESVIVSGLTAEDEVIQLRAGADSFAGSAITIVETNE